MPADVLEGLEKGTDDREGKLRLTFKYPDLFPTLKFALDSETRQKVFIENENKVGLSLAMGEKLLTIQVQRQRPTVQRSYHP